MTRTALPPFEHRFLPPLSLGPHLVSYANCFSHGSNFPNLVPGKMTFLPSRSLSFPSGHLPFFFGLVLSPSFTVWLFGVFPQICWTSTIAGLQGLVAGTALILLAFFFYIPTPSADCLFRIFWRSIRCASRSSFPPIEQDFLSIPYTSSWPFLFVSCFRDLCGSVQLLEFPCVASSSVRLSLPSASTLFFVSPSHQAPFPFPRSTFFAD